MRELNTKLLQNYIESQGKKGLVKLAANADLSPSTISKMLDGTYKNPTLDTIAKLCRATGIEFEKLFPDVSNHEAA